MKVHKHFIYIQLLKQRQKCTLLRFSAFQKRKEKKLNLLLHCILEHIKTLTKHSHWNIWICYTAATVSFEFPDFNKGLYLHPLCYCNNKIYNVLTSKIKSSAIHSLLYTLRFFNTHRPFQHYPPSCFNIKLILFEWDFNHRISTALQIPSVIQSDNKEALLYMEE